jgi:hypothetical protein
MPKAETALVEAVLTAGHTYAAATTAQGRRTSRSGRAKALRQVLGGNRTFRGWVGNLADLSTTADGHAFVRIDMPDTKISLGTWEDPASDKQDHTLIRRTDRLYRHLTNLSIGTPVIVSGRFVPSSQDFLAESSLNEAGTMRTPTFIARFDDIRPYPEGRQRRR